MELVVVLPIKFCEQQCDVLHGEIDRKVAESRGVCHVDGAVASVLDVEWRRPLLISVFRHAMDDMWTEHHSTRHL